MSLSHSDIDRAHDIGREEGRHNGELAGMKYVVREMIAAGFDERRVNSTYRLAVAKWKRNQHRIPKDKGGE